MVGQGMTFGSTTMTSEAASFVTIPVPLFDVWRSVANWIMSVRSPSIVGGVAALAWPVAPRATDSTISNANSVRAMAPRHDRVNSRSCVEGTFMGGTPPVTDAGNSQAGWLVATGGSAE